MTPNDPCEKLKPPEPTPESELCRCPGDRPVKLMHALSFNPVHCLDCNLEVPPDRLKLTQHLVDALAHWNWIDGAIDRLWLDSGPYESWAKVQLSDIHNGINTEGRKVVEQIAEIRKCYYWYFQDQSADDYSPISTCPCCGKKFSEYKAGIFLQLICEECRIVTVGE
jgi:predicted  nucleic acid-binding Zn ribbon protein